MNDELINSAVSFLKDANVSSSPLNKKIEFLESKGLSEVEIEEALKRANGQSSSNQNTNQQQIAPQPHQTLQPQAPIDYYNVAAPQVPERTWQDYFIMATATAGVTYGLYQVVSKYLIPSIIPPTQKSIEDDKAKIDEEFIKIDKLLEQMSIEQKEIKDSNESKLKEIDVVIENVNDFLSKYNKDKLKFDDDLRLMKLEIDNLKNSIEKNMLLTKENIRDELKDITEELTSLKQLIKVRGEKNASDSATPARKIAPVSSIPSASEILKKAKSGSSTSAKPPGTSTSDSTFKNSSVSPSKNSFEGNPSETSTSSLSKSVYAAGIPEWQLKHKQEEEKQEHQSNEKDDDSSNLPEYKPHKDLGTNDDVVKESLANVGVPSWQLNTNSKPSSQKDSSSNVPSWQSNASA